jgi:hypothetical protein
MSADNGRTTKIAAALGLVGDIVREANFAMTLGALGLGIGLDRGLNQPLTLGLALGGAAVGRLMDRGIQWIIKRFCDEGTKEGDVPRGRLDHLPAPKRASGPTMTDALS